MRYTDHQIDILEESFRQVLCKIGVINDDTKPQGPELILAADEYLKHGHTPNELRREIYQLFALAVMAAGGQVVIDDVDVESLERCEILAEHNFRNHTTIYTVSKRR